MDITSLLLSKKYVEDSLAGAGAVKGKSAYEVAQANGFTGSEQDWLASLNGVTPHIGENGNWFIGETDTGVIASPSLAGYATEDFVNTELAKLDFSPYATKKELAAEIGKIIIPDVSAFVTQADIDKAIEAIPEVNLDAYATKDEVRKAIAAIDFPEVDLTPYALKTEIPSLAGFATEDYVNQKIEDIEHPQQDLSDYAKKSELPDTTGLASETWVTQMIQNAQLSGDGEVDLTNYPTKDEVQKLVDQEIAEIVHPTPNLDGYAKTEDIPDVSEFVTGDEVDKKIAAVPAPDLSDYAKRSELPDTSKFVTEDDVKDMIPSHEGYVTQDELEEAVGGIQIPEVPSLDGYATEDFVTQKIAEAELNDKEVDLSAYYTKSEVEQKLAEIEHPTVDLEGYVTEEEMKQAIGAIEHPTTDLTGYATEDYVNSALENLDIPEAQQPTVYEVTSDEVDLELLIPADTEFVGGDILIVTNSTGIKSAYHYNGKDWVACDGNVDASKVIMPIDITLAGSYTQVGNLTKTSTGTATFATKGKSVAAALQEMLSKREQPSSPTNPSISCTATGMSAVEVGTTVTPGWKVSLNSGSYTYGPETGITPKTWTITDNKGNTSNEASGSFPSFVITDSDNYSYTVTVTHDAGAIAYDNLGDESNPIVRIAANSAPAVSKSGLKGYRQWFVYVGTNNTDSVDSNFIRSTTAKGNAYNAATINNLAIPAGTTRVMVAIPQKLTDAKYTYGKELTSVIDVDGMGLDVIGNFTKSEVMVEGKDGATAVAYNVWVCENANGLAATKYNLVIG